jgi:uncharacterized protein YcgL (UPF0745 family)
MSDTTHCCIYRSPRKDEMYLYLAQEAGFDDVPEALMQRFGTPQFVMELDLSAERKLARVEVSSVIAALEESGFFLQMPPELKPELYHGNED